MDKIQKNLKKINQFIIVTVIILAAALILFLNILL